MKMKQKQVSAKVYERQIETARQLLHIGAVELKPQEPFTWSSGIQSPIYCDNRLTMSFPQVRSYIAQGLTELITENFGEIDILAGTATAGIPHAAWVAERMDKPMVYVRSSAKGHGKQNQIEGKIQAQNRVIVIEDLISTGKSSLQAVESLKEAGANVIGVVAIFSYGFEQAQQAFEAAHVPFFTLTNYATLIDLAEQDQLFQQGDLNTLKDWDPFRS